MTWRKKKVLATASVPVEEQGTYDANRVVEASQRLVQQSLETTRQAEALLTLVEQRRTARKEAEE